MRLPSRQELTAAIAGVRGLVRLDAKALTLFDASHDGFWQSFWAAAIIAPISIALLTRQAIMAPPDSLWRFLAFQTIGYVIGWLAFPLAMVRISTMLGRGDRYYGYMVAYNWFHLVEIVLMGPLILLGVLGVLPLPIESLLSLIAFGVILGYQWFIAKNALKVEGGTAAALVVIDLLLNVLIDKLADALP